MDQALLALQIACAAVLLVAAVGKVVRADDFAAAIRLSRLPADKFLMVAVPTVEIALALALLIATDETLRIALGATTTLFLSFTLWAVSVIARGIKLKCGCFGGSSREVTMRTVLRNSSLVVMAGAGTVLSLSAESALSNPTLWSSISITVSAAMLSVLVAVRFGLPGLVLKIEKPEKPLLQIQPKE